MQLGSICLLRDQPLSPAGIDVRRV